MDSVNRESSKYVGYAFYTYPFHINFYTNIEEEKAQALTIFEEAIQLAREKGNLRLVYAIKKYRAMLLPHIREETSSEAYTAAANNLVTFLQTMDNAEMQNQLDAFKRNTDKIISCATDTVTISFYSVKALTVGVGLICLACIASFWGVIAIGVITVLAAISNREANKVAKIIQAWDQYRQQVVNAGSPNAASQQQSSVTQPSSLFSRWGKSMHSNTDNIELQPVQISC